MAANDTNYYLLLDISLDPPVKDKARLEAAIQKKLSEWNQGVNNPTHGLLFKSNAAKVPDIKKALVLGSESERDAVIAEAMTIAKGRVASLLEAIAKSGFITEAQIKEVCKKSPQFSEKTIRKMIKVPIKDCAGPSFVIPKKPPEPSVKPTDTMLMDKFEKNLQVIKKKDVYDFLGCTRVSPPATMCRIAGELLAKAGKAAVKTAEVSASQELAGLVNTYFQKPNAKEAYEIALKTYLAQKKLVEIFAIRCLSKSVEWSAYQQSISDCRSIGMSKEEAEYFAYEYYCLKRKCPPPSAPDNEKPQPAVHYCKACLAPNPEGASVCQSCGLPFKVKCPKCGQEVQLDRPHCSKCAFPIGDMPLAISLLKEGRLQLASGDISGADRSIEKALVYWPGNSDCEELKSSIAKKRKQAQEEAEARERKAREEIAKAHLDNIALSGSLRADVNLGRRVALGWQRASVRNAAMKTDPARISYFVVRKEDAAPAGPMDGERLAETQQLRYEDTSCVPGVIYGYAVFPGYAGVVCKGGISSARVMTLADVSDLQSMCDDGEIQIRWKLPPNAVGVKCVRKAGGEPRSDQDGEQINLQSGAKGLVDKGLKNRTPYGYRIAAVFKGPSGEHVSSAGVTCVAVPAERPKMLDSLRYELSECNLKLSWQPIAGCTVRLLVTQSPLGQYGAFLPETDSMFAGAEVIKDVDQDSGVGTWKIPTRGVFFVTPLTCKDGMALLGKAIPVIPSVSNVSILRRSGNIEISWDWPSGCEEVLLVWRTDRMPSGPDDASASRVSVTQLAYRRDMAYIISHVGAASYYVSVYSVSRNEGKEVYSLPQNCSSIGESERRTLAYSFSKKKQFVLFGKTTVTLNLKVSSGGLPDVILVKKFRRQPLSRQDGTVCFRLSALNDCEASIILPDGVAESGAFLKLFFNNPDLDTVYRVNHPGFADMKM